jgi:hypothetical protein
MKPESALCVAGVFLCLFGIGHLPAEAEAEATSTSLELANALQPESNTIQEISQASITASALHLARNTRFVRFPDSNLVYSYSYRTWDEQPTILIVPESQIESIEHLIIDFEINEKTP